MGDDRRATRSLGGEIAASGSERGQREEHAAGTEHPAAFTLLRLPETRRLIVGWTLVYGIGS